MHLIARHGLAAIRNATPALLGVSLFLLVAVLGAGTERQRRQPLDRRRLPPDPALRAGQGGADPLRRRPARPQAEAGALDRRASCPSCWSPAAACLLIMLEPDMGTTMVIAFAIGATLVAAGARPRDLGKIGAGDRRPGAADDDRRALPDGPPDRLPATPAPTPKAPASRRRRRRSRSAPAASSGSGSATACRRPSTCPRPTPT